MSSNFPPPLDPAFTKFPILPILPADTPRRTQVEKYGALFYLGMAGLVLLIAMLSWFAWGAWSLREVWGEVYAIHDPERPLEARVEAAYALCHDPRVNQRQLWDIALRKSVPPLARYVVAEGLTAEATEADPRGYAVAVARSETWPDWLRLLLLRPMAYAAIQGREFPREPLVELTRHTDPVIRLWAAYALAAGHDSEASQALETASRQNTPEAELAALMDRALKAPGRAEQVGALDEATLWLRHHHPEAAKLWSGWDVVNGRIVAPPAGSTIRR